MWWSAVFSQAFQSRRLLVPYYRKRSVSIWSKTLVAIPRKRKCRRLLGSIQVYMDGKLYKCRISFSCLPVFASQIRHQRLDPYEPLAESPILHTSSYRFENPMLIWHIFRKTVFAIKSRQAKAVWSCNSSNLCRDNWGTSWGRGFVLRVIRFFQELHLWTSRSWQQSIKRHRLEFLMIDVS